MSQSWETFSGSNFERLSEKSAVSSGIQDNDISKCSLVVSCLFSHQHLLSSSYVLVTELDTKEIKSSTALLPSKDL